MEGLFQLGPYKYIIEMYIASLRKGRPPNLILQNAVMSSVGIASNKPNCRMVNCIKSLESGGRCMDLHYIAII